MYSLLRPVLFSLDAERSHDLALSALSLVSKSSLALNALAQLYAKQISAKPVTLMGMNLAHPLGLAAGLDKQGVAGDALSALGFSFIEYGTVTPLPQAGNVKPRLFRLNEFDAIINRMGFNSIGLKAFLDNIQKSRRPHFKGLNIGKNAATPMQNAIDDYVIGLKAVYEVADYICINISSPNTKNLRELQGDAALGKLLATLNHSRDALADKTGQHKPMALKVAPDLNNEQFDAISKAILKHKLNGLVVSNTTLKRNKIQAHPLANETGGLSGQPLAELSTQCIAAFSQRLENEIPIIGVGGIHDVKTAQAKLTAGATALQLYSSLVFQGPAIVKQIMNGL